MGQAGHRYTPLSRLAATMVAGLIDREDNGLETSKMRHVDPPQQAVARLAAAMARPYQLTTSHPSGMLLMVPVSSAEHQTIDNQVNMEVCTSGRKHGNSDTCCCARCTIQGRRWMMHAIRGAQPTQRPRKRPA
jgi:hypothetical protein